MSGYIVCQCPPECHIVFSDMNPQLTSLFIIKIKVFSKLTHLSLRFPLTLCVFWLLINVALLPPFFPLINSPYGCLKALSLEVNILFFVICWNEWCALLQRRTNSVECHMPRWMVATIRLPVRYICLVQVLILYKRQTSIISQSCGWSVHSHNKRDASELDWKQAKTKSKWSKSFTGQKHPHKIESAPDLI